MRVEITCERCGGKEMKTMENQESEHLTPYTSPSTVSTIPCWNCTDLMKRFGQDTFYHFYQCPTCGKQRAVEREDREILTMPEEEDGREQGAEREALETPCEEPHGTDQ